jgi:hypothetical protein
MEISYRRWMEISYGRWMEMTNSQAGGKLNLLLHLGYFQCNKNPQLPMATKVEEEL